MEGLVTTWRLGDDSRNPTPFVRPEVESRSLIPNWLVHRTDAGVVVGGMVSRRGGHEGGDVVRGVPGSGV